MVAKACDPTPAGGVLETEVNTPHVLGDLPHQVYLACAKSVCLFKVEFDVSDSPIGRFHVLIPAPSWGWEIRTPGDTGPGRPTSSDPAHLLLPSGLCWLLYMSLPLPHSQEEAADGGAPPRDPIFLPSCTHVAHKDGSVVHVYLFHRSPMAGAVCRESSLRKGLRGACLGLGALSCEGQAPDAYGPFLTPVGRGHPLGLF